MPSVTWGWFSLIQTTVLNKPSMTFCLLPPFLWLPALSLVHLILLLLEGDPCSFLDALHVWYILFHDLLFRSSVPFTFGEYSFSRASWLLRIAFIRQLLLVFASSSLLFFKTKKEKKKDKGIGFSSEEAFWEENACGPVILHLKQGPFLMMRITLAWAEPSQRTLST